MCVLRVVLLLLATALFFSFFLFFFVFLWCLRDSSEAGFFLSCIKYHLKAGVMGHIFLAPRVIP